MAEITLAAIPRLDFVTRGSVAWGAEAAGTISFSMEGHGGVDSYCIVKLGHAQVQPCPISYCAIVVQWRGEDPSEEGILRNVCKGNSARHEA